MFSGPFRNALAAVWKRRTSPLAQGLDALRRVAETEGERGEAERTRLAEAARRGFRVWTLALAVVLCSPLALALSAGLRWHSFLVWLALVAVCAVQAWKHAAIAHHALTGEDVRGFHARLARQPGYLARLWRSSAGS